MPRGIPPYGGHARGATKLEHTWLSTLPDDISTERRVGLTKLRWRIERDYVKLKHEAGIGHAEGQGWSTASWWDITPMPSMRVTTPRMLLEVVCMAC